MASCRRAVASAEGKSVEGVDVDSDVDEGVDEDVASASSEGDDEELVVEATELTWISSFGRESESATTLALPCRY